MANEDEDPEFFREMLGEDRKFSQQQYDLLKSCSDKMDMTEWNEWRANNPEKDILLEGVDLSNFYLEKVLLNTITKQNISGQNVNISGKAYLNKAIFVGSNLQGANLFCAYAEEAKFDCASLNGAYFNSAHLKGASFWRAKLQNAKFIKADLKNTKFHDAHLERAKFHRAIMCNSYLQDSHLLGTIFYFSNLHSANFQTALVNGATSFWGSKVNKKTNFLGVGLDITRIEPATKQLLEYNIRRNNWEQWYRGKSENKWIIRMHQLLTLPVRLFWWISNYGLSTWRIILTFFALAFVFALIYWLWPSCVLVNGIVGDIKGFVHALYFSVVTMTTLGFGDIAANPDSWKGQVLLMVQVILGYVLLGALVTRFAVLFTAGGPAGKFSPSQTKKTGESEKLNE